MCVQVLKDSFVFKTQLGVSLAKGIYVWFYELVNG